MDIEKLKKQGLSDKDAEKVKSLAQSDAGKRIGKIVDVNELRRAAQTGDQKTLEGILGKVMATEDGRQLMKKLEESFGKK